MNPTTTRWLVALALGCFAYIYFYERHVPNSQERAERATKLLPDFVPAEVNSLEIIRTNPVVRVARSNETWRLTLPVNYPAQPTGIENFLDTLASLRRSVYIPAKEMLQQPGGLAAFGLDAPRFNVIVQQNTNRIELRVGGQAPLGEQLYVQLVGSEGVFVTDAVLLERFPLSADDWRDRALLNMKGLAFDRIEIRAGALSNEIERNATNRQWRLTKPMSARANSQLIEQVLQILQNARVSQFVSDATAADLESFGLQPPQLELFLGRGTNDLLSVKFGNSPTNQQTQVHARLSDHGNIVLTPRELVDYLRPSRDRFLDPHLISFAAAAVDRIEVRAAESFTLQRQTNGFWRVLEPFNFDADAELVRKLLTNLNALKTVELVKGNVTDFAVFGLTSTNQQYTLFTTLTNSAGSLTNSLLAQIEFGTNYQTTNVYVRRSDEKSVYATRLDDRLQLPQAAFELRDRRLWNFTTNNVGSVTISLKGRTHKLSRTATGQWNLPAGALGINGALLLDETIYRLGQLQVVAWIARGDDKLARYGFPEAAHRLSLEIKTGEKTQTLTIEFGQQSPWTTPYAAVMLDGQHVVFGFPARIYDLYEIFLRDLNQIAPGAAP